MYIYLAEKNGLTYPILLKHTISLGILIREGAILLPNREFYQETLGL